MFDPEAQILLALLSAGAMLSAAWLVLHVRDVALLLRPVFPRLAPGTGRCRASFRALCAGLTVLGYSLVGQVWAIARAAGPDTRKGAAGP
ncbi:hypothetical protein [Erythrobacter sp. WG]|uniref:hypothetical protein n=1 Tax=Erythrobacter sp. WG TaxID=2985510 RepID=UPI00226F4BB9|nr:hypothetical protein [Erythrobacter sp. WG]MCX9145901.1 hypothetical protein [Erythrobacter sp. WG]